MMWMARFVRDEAQENRGHLESFQSAMRHPPGVGVDEPPLLTDAPLPRPVAAPVAVGSATPVPTMLPSSPAPASSSRRPPVFPPTPAGPCARHEDAPTAPSPGVHLPRPSPSSSPAPLPLPLDPDLPLDSQDATCTPTPVTPSTLPLPVDPVSGDWLPSSHLAALTMQSFAAEQSASDNFNVAHFTQLRGLMVNIATAVNVSSQSAAASANRLDGAMAKVVAGNVDVTAAAAAIKAAVPHLYGSVPRPSKRAKHLALCHMRSEGVLIAANPEIVSAARTLATGASAAGLPSPCRRRLRCPKT